MNGDADGAALAAPSPLRVPDPLSAPDPRIAPLDSGNESDQRGSTTTTVDELEFSNGLLTPRACFPLPDKGNLLLRLFESPLFDMHLGIAYLYNSKDSGVQMYLANRLFGFEKAKVDFYVPQLVNMYINMPELAPYLYPYFIYRCKQEVDFALKILWLLSAYDIVIRHKKGSGDSASPSKLKKLIMSEELWPGKAKTAPHVKRAVSTVDLASHGQSHARHTSDMTATRARALLTRSSASFTHLHGAEHLGDLSSGSAFDNGCTCSIVQRVSSSPATCSCGASQLSPMHHFTQSLVNISRTLAALPAELRTARLQAEVSQLNLNLPARLWLPTNGGCDHHVVRIPHSHAVVLNSKERAPYLIYVEVVRCFNTLTDPLPVKQHDKPLRTSHSCENLTASMNNGGDSATDSFSMRSFISARDMDDTVSCFSEEDVLTSHGDSTLIKVPSPDTQSIVSSDSIISVDSVLAGTVRDRIGRPEKAAAGGTVFERDNSDPSAAVLKEDFNTKRQRIQKQSRYSHIPGWDLAAVIVKASDDLRQELLASQFMQALGAIWEEEHVPVWIRPYNILVMSEDSGMIEPIVNTVSLSQILKQSKQATLKDYFVKEFGGNRMNETFLAAQGNFIASCAGYSILCYLLQVKDRHNGNILLDNTGHLIHIDFGFMLELAPGMNMGFENAPFKLEQSYIDIMGGMDSEFYGYFKILLLKALLAARKHQDRLVHIVEIMQTGGHLPCFRSGGPDAVTKLKCRFHLNKTEEELRLLIEQMVAKSLNSWTTYLYDQFQHWQNSYA